MEYNEPQDKHDFDGLEVTVNHGYEIETDQSGYLVRIFDTNSHRNIGISIRFGPDGKVASLRHYEY